MKPSPAARFLLGFPAVALLAAFMIAPLCLTLYISTLERGAFGGVRWDTHSIDAYAKLLLETDLLGRTTLNADYLAILWRSVSLAALTTAVTFAVGFPTALYISTMAPRRAALLLFLVTVPFWTNLLVRNFAWILLLRAGGPIDRFLSTAGLIDGPLAILYTPVATTIGLVYSFLPFMILPVYVALTRVDRSYVEAAFDLGASRLQTLREIVLPLAFPGIVAGCVLVFVPCLGAYVSPELLGGAKSMMLGNLIQAQFGASRNWPFGAALATILLLVLSVGLAAIAGANRRARGRK